MKNKNQENYAPENTGSFNIRTEAFTAITVFCWAFDVYS